MHAAQSTCILGRALATQAHIRTRFQPDRSLKSNYPGELLDAIRLLSLVHEGRKPHHSRKLAVSPLITAVPGTHGSKVGPSSSLRIAAPESGLLRRHSRSLCGAPHAGSGMAHPYPDRVSQCPSPVPSSALVFDKKIADLCLTQPDPNLGLRTVTTQELLSADRKLLAAISDLLRQQRSLDDALYELTHMRNDVRSLLQLRPKMSKPSVPAPPRPATPR